MMQHSINIKLPPEQRKAIEDISERNQSSLGAATRLLLKAGMKSLGIAAEPMV